MEVHAHSHLASGETHTERKKWFHYFWEFLMLFLAVTLGFLVENQREHYIEHQRLIRFAKLGNSLPPGFLEHVAEWKRVFENIVITAREKHELPYLNIIEERNRALILISSLKKEYHFD